MADKKEFNPVLKGFIKSDPLTEIILNSRNVVNSLMKGFTDEQKLLNECAQVIINNFCDSRDAYNDKAKQFDICFLQPCIKQQKKRNQERVYHEYRWASFKKKPYVKSNKSESTASKSPDRSENIKQWTIREIKHNGKRCWTKLDLQKGMNYKSQDFLPVVLETEHCLRFIRDRYEKLNAYISAIKKLKMPDELDSLVQTSVQSLGQTENDIALVRDQMAETKFTSDPFAVQNNASLFHVFYDITNDSLDDVEMPDDMDMDIDVPDVLDIPTEF